MLQSKLILDKDYQIGKVDKRIFASFIEHLGRAVYTGIYQPNSQYADSHGFRTDVINLIHELNIPLVRYPGGNFVSGFRWEDSIGPQEKRPKRLDYAWKTTETNEFGLHEFQQWAQIANVETMMALNLGLRGVDAARNLLEYCNHPSNSYYSDLRIKNGSKDPFNIHLWCLGNEMDGEWQIGHKTADEYGKLANETAKLFKLYDKSNELVICGSSADSMSTFGSWETTVLNKSYENVDYLSIHQYYRNDDENEALFLSSSTKMDRFIQSEISFCDSIKNMKHSNKTINLSFDEWNVWFHSQKADEKIKPWSIAPPLLEDIYDATDALVVGTLLITMLRHADRIKIACLAQLVNVIAPIMTETDGSTWKQTIFYPFLHASLYGRGISLQPVVKSDSYSCTSYENVSYLDTASVYHEDSKTITVFAVNKSTTESMELQVDLRSFGKYKVNEHIILDCSDLKATNSAREQKIHPETQPITHDIILKPASWNVLQFIKE